MKSASYYQISKNGFLPDKTIEDFPKDWEHYLFLKDYFTNPDCDHFRQLVYSLPIFDEEKLKITNLNIYQKRLLFCFFTTVMSKFIHGCGPENVISKIPEQIGKPLHLLAKDIGVTPHMSYYSCVIWNIILKDEKKPYSLDNCELIFKYSMSQNQDVRAFLIQHAMIEQSGGHCLTEICSLWQYIANNDVEKVKATLKLISQSIYNALEVLKVFHHKVDRDAFLNFRVLFNGTTDTKLFPEGLRLEGTDYPNFSMPNANGGQSPLLQVFGELVNPSFSEETQKFFNYNKTTLPVSHREFLNDMIPLSKKLHEYVTQTHDEELKEDFEEIGKSLLSFRKNHLILANRYHDGNPRFMTLLEKIVKEMSQSLTYYTSKRGRDKKKGGDSTHFGIVYIIIGMIIMAILFKLFGHFFTK